MAIVKCKECSRDISDQAASCPNCGAPQKAEKNEPKKSQASLVVVAAIVVVLGIVFVYQQAGIVSDQGGVSLPTSPLSAPPVVTMAEYNQIRDGMTYEQVRKIIGANGQELSRNNIAEITTVMYSWSNSNGSNMNAMFQNDGLIQKAQFGLK